MQKHGDINVKTPRQIERYFKGAANHWRLRILFLLSDHPGLSLLDIAESVNGNMKTISEHTARLFHAGLIDKRYKGRTVLHNTSQYGERFIKFIKTL